MDEQLEKLIAETAERNPDLVKKFGNPLDKNDPRNWTPTERAEKGLSQEEQLKLLGLDVESQSMAVAMLVQKNLELEFQLDKLQRWAADKMAEEFVTLVRENPEKASEYLKSMMEMGEPPSKNVPVAGQEPLPMVQTVNGPIRLDQIPGFKDDPNWRPSPDWLDANCTCDVHTKKRAESEGKGPFDFPTGMYL